MSNTTASNHSNLDVYDVPSQPLARERIAYVGPAGTHSERALALHLGVDPPDIGERGLPCRDVTDALLAVRQRQVDLAIVPWRNALGGSVHETLDAVLDEGLRIVGASVVPVRLCLAALSPRPLHELRVVRSHPEALRQCRKLLRRLSSARREPTSSTAAAARGLRLSRGSDGADEIGILCTLETARRSGLSVLVEDAADHSHNQTRFVVIARRDDTEHRVDQAAANHTALVMTTVHRHGALARCLTLLAEAEIQLTHLESRPLPGRPWEVQFAIEAEGTPTQAPLRGALDRLRQECTHLDVLGSWHEPDRPVRTLPAVSEIEVSTQVAEDPKPAPSSDPPARLVDAHSDRGRTIVHVGDVPIGGDQFVLIAGPCSVENAEQVTQVAAAVAAAGGRLLRGGAFKPRTSPYSFQGLGEEGLRLLAEAGRAHGLPVVTEVMRPEQIEVCAEYSDMLQVGARNMQNFSLLAEIGASRRPVLLKRGMSASIEDVLNAAEYILARGNTQVVLCERGIRTFETATRSTLDLSAVPVLQERTHLPVIVDPSHAAGVRRYVPALSRAAKAIGADGLIVEVHPEPQNALSDGPQALTIPMWNALARELLA